MRIDFYDARITDHNRTVLVKEKGLNYGCQKMDNPKEISLMLKELLHSVWRTISSSDIILI